MKAIIFILALTAVFCEKLEFESHTSIGTIKNGFNFANMISDTQKIIVSALRTIRVGINIKIIEEDFIRLSSLCRPQISFGVWDLEKFSKAILTGKAKMPKEKI